MNFVEVTSYGNKTGSNTNFLLSQSDCRPQMMKILDFLMTIRGYTDKETNEIEEEIQNAITRA
jgi:hypothetical protein